MFNWARVGLVWRLRKFSTLVYGPNQDRIKHSDSNGRVTKYVGGIYEEVTKDGVTQKLHYVGDFAIFVQTDGVTPTSKHEYLHRDHIGSVVAISNEAANSASDIQWQANGAWGERRFAQWNGPQDLDFVPTSTARGFTDHEQLDAVGLIHMNGRVYDPELGRFLSADPYVQAPYNTQSYNRYAYVFNNPLSFTDPSGYECYQTNISSSTAGGAEGSSGHVFDSQVQWSSTGGSLCGQDLTDFYWQQQQQQQQQQEQQRQYENGYQYLMAKFAQWYYDSVYENYVNNMDPTCSKSLSKTCDGPQWTPEEGEQLSNITGSAFSVVGIGKINIYNPKTLKLSAYKASKSLGMQELNKIPDFVTGKLRWAKQKMHLKGSAPPDKSYLNSMADAQAVLDEIMQGKGQILKVIEKDNRLYFKSENITGTYINRDYGVEEVTNIFMVKGAGTSNVVPANPIVNF